jgi:hypothetical protein
MFHDIRVGKDGDPIAIGTFRGLDAIHTEASRETSDNTKDRLEGFALMMRDVIFEDFKNQQTRA